MSERTRLVPTAPCAEEWDMGARTASVSTRSVTSGLRRKVMGVWGRGRGGGVVGCIEPSVECGSP